MGLLGTSNNNIVQAIDAQSAANFKATNNLLTLQTNHVEEFFEYHGEGFLMALEKLMEDTCERVVSQLLSQLKLTQGTSGEMIIHTDCLRAYEAVTEANITLDVQNLLAAAVNTEVIAQRKMARQQYLETQGFNPAVPQQQPAQQQYQQYQQPRPTIPNPGMPAAGMGMQQPRQVPVQRNLSTPNNTPARFG